MIRGETAWTWWTLPPAIAGCLAQRSPGTTGLFSFAPRQSECVAVTGLRRGGRISARVIRYWEREARALLGFKDSARWWHGATDATAYSSPGTAGYDLLALIARRTLYLLRTDHRDGALRDPRRPGRLRAPAGAGRGAAPLHAGVPRAYGRAARDAMRGPPCKPGQADPYTPTTRRPVGRLGEPRRLGLELCGRPSRGRASCRLSTPESEYGSP